MAIYKRCINCKKTYKTSLNECPACGEKNAKYLIKVQHIHKIVRVTATSLTIARAVEAKIKSELIEDTYYDRKIKVLTINEAWDYYYSYIQNINKSAKRELARYKKHVAPLFGTTKMDNIDKLQLQKYIVTLKKNKNAPQTIKHIVGIISRIYNWSIKNNIYNGNNPASGLELPKINNQTEKYLTHEQINILLNTLNNFGKYKTQIYSEYRVKVANLIKFLLFTGLRKSEALNLTWENTDIENRQIYLKNTKNGNDAIIPINKTAFTILENQKALSKNSHFVFSGQTNAQIKDISFLWDVIKKEAQLPSDFRLHDLRHTYASILVSNGVSLYTVQRLLNHKTVAVTQRYAHLADKQKREATEILDLIIN